MTSVGTALMEATARLRPFSPSARLDAELLLAHVLGVGRAQVVAGLREELSEQVCEQFVALTARRADLEPVAYLTGEREFYGMMLYVDRRVLVPRPETELLVDLALRAARSAPRKDLRVADIGTGSGAIAVAIAAHLPEARVLATDLSIDALDVARRNIQRHGLGERIILLHGAGLGVLPGQVDLLLSNPPYTVLAEVDENVRRHEPHLALDAGPEGLAVIRELIVDAPRYLDHGTMLIEIAAWQGPAVVDLAVAAFPGADIAVHRDLAGLDRVLEIRVSEMSEPVA
ncbi:MAG TPA: peptide chain release factor N(5)-glutamine methyltransferase [Herpetosiphonaceae bacterium]|nr:peptide chain release factor N(5)-glutamine methyltransferase [Herpetosiphonaceae bacterium]